MLNYHLTLITVSLVAVDGSLQLVVTAANDIFGGFFQFFIGGFFVFELVFGGLVEYSW